MPVLLPSRHPDNGPGQDPCPPRKRDSIFHERARTGGRRREEEREKEIENTREVSPSRERSELSNIRFLGSCKRSAISEKRVFDGRSRTGAQRDDSRRALGDDTPKRHPDNAPGQDPCPSRKRDSIFHERARTGERRREEKRERERREREKEIENTREVSPSRERSELSNIRFVGSCKRSAISEKRVFEKRVFDERSRTGALRDDRRGVRRGRLYGMLVLLASRHPDNGPGQDLCPSRKRDSIFHERARTGERRREEEREKEIENTREVSPSRERSELSTMDFLRFLFGETRC